MADGIDEIMAHMKRATVLRIVREMRNLCALLEPVFLSTTASVIMQNAGGRKVAGIAGLGSSVHLRRPLVLLQPVDCTPALLG